MRRNNILIALVLIVIAIITVIISFFLKLFVKDKRKPQVRENKEEERYLGKYEVKRGQKAKNLSYVYDSEESLKRIEVEKKKKTGKKKKEPKKEAEEEKPKGEEKEKEPKQAEEKK